jgi:hypothetical protein
VNNTRPVGRRFTSGFCKPIRPWTWTASRCPRTAMRPMPWSGISDTGSGGGDERIAFTTMVLDSVIGRRGICNTASSLWPCQNHSRKRYTVGMVFLFVDFSSSGGGNGRGSRGPCRPGGGNGSAPAHAPAPMTDIHDILPPVPVGIDAPWLVPVLIALAAAAVLAAGLVVLEKTQKSRHHRNHRARTAPGNDGHACPG